MNHSCQYKSFIRAQTQELSPDASKSGDRTSQSSYNENHLR